MENFFKTDFFKFWLFALLVFLTRLPFLSEGYGLDGDSWSVAITARNMAETEIFEVSRFPGYPVHEYISSVFYNGIPLRLNLLTALISTIGILFFALTLRAWKFKMVFLAASMLAFVPVVYINSTTTIDYNWALSFMLISLYFIATRNPLMAGIFMGLAIGSRITSGAMLLPYSIMLLGSKNRLINTWHISLFCFGALLVGALCYYPVYDEYGFAFLQYYDVPYPSIPKVLYKFSFETWGVLGILGIILAIVLLFIPVKRTQRLYLFPRSINEKYIIAWLIAIDLFIIAFLKLPMESGYLIPVIPFTILVFGKYLYRKAFVAFSVFIILSSFLVNISPVEREDASTPSVFSTGLPLAGEKLSVDFIKGPILSYESRRKNGMLFTDEIIKSFDTITVKSMLLTGRWHNQIKLQIQSNENAFIQSPVVLQDYITEDSLLNYIGKNYQVYYLPKQDFFNLQMRKVDINLFGGKPYISE